MMTDYFIIPGKIALRLSAVDRGINHVSFISSYSHFSSPGNERKNRHLKEAKEQLTRYFEGGLYDFHLPLVYSGTLFQVKVWKALLEIPYGTTQSYGELARKIGVPGAARAVGAVCGQNPIAIFIPCHRVVGKDGSLTGFGGGLSLKRRLLMFEKEHCPALTVTCEGEGQEKTSVYC